MKRTLLAMSLALSAAMPSMADDAVQMVSADAAYDMDESMSLAFIFHIDEKLAEQDVFFEKVAGSGEVFRPTGATRNMDAPLFAPAEAVPHTPLQIENTGPWPRGKALGMTLGEWFSAKGTGNYSCANGKGIVNLRFENLVPNGLYTVWHDFAIWPPTEPFLGFYDTPLGSRDGTENVFTADENGDAKFFRVITPCLQLTGEQLIAELAIAWHSDGKTHGPMTGEFSTQTHVQMYVPLPKRTGL
ncbi:hypothetical protein [uncultured Roseibium sp.]|uniref:hypothetical protein n=1 Tax=uncultured Roseibium sp. TaxID=1936171 RepID=UPI00263126DD|nr:hypothetical protein [uncultured Roseibium sp.]